MINIIEGIKNNFVLDKDKDSLLESEIQWLDTLSLDDINKLIDECNKKYNYHNAVQNGLKLTMNSFYGAFGNEFYVCSTKEIAEAITTMGRDLIKHMDNINETYWYEYWHEDYELHEKLGILGKVNKIDNSYIHLQSKTECYEDEVVTQQNIEDGIYQRKVPVSSYVDTDSCFVTFYPAMNSIEDGFSSLNLTEQEFIEIISKNRLEPLFKSKLNRYAKKFNVVNIQDFELENINEAIIFLTKKKYIKHTIWEDGRQYDRLKNIIPKGVDLIKSGTPKFARENVMEIIKYIFDNKDSYSIKNFLKFVQDLRKRFEVVDIDDICLSTNINESDYWSRGKIQDVKTGQLIDDKGIVDDKNSLIYGKGTYFTRKAAGLYNYLLNQNKELQTKYEFIKTTKIKYYPCLGVEDLNDKFAYIPGMFPTEFAPKVDYDSLFEATVSKQVNTYIECLGLPPLNKRLKLVISLF